MATHASCEQPYSGKPEAVNRSSSQRPPLGVNPHDKLVAQRRNMINGGWIKHWQKPNGEMYTTREPPEPTEPERKP